MQGSFHKRTILMICTIVFHITICILYIVFMNTHLPAIIICLIAIHSLLMIVIKQCRAFDNNAQSIFRFSTFSTESSQSGPSEKVATGEFDPMVAKKAIAGKSRIISCELTRVLFPSLWCRPCSEQLPWPRHSTALARA